MWAQEAIHMSKLNTVEMLYKLSNKIQVNWEDWEIQAVWFTTDGSPRLGAVGIPVHNIYKVILLKYNQSDTKLMITSCLAIIASKRDLHQDI